MKKALSIFTLCLLLITGCAQQPVSGASVASSANSEATSSSASSPVLKEGDYNYIVQDESVTIMKYNGTAENVTIPDTIVGLPVKAIGESAFEENATLKTIKISDNVMIIGDSAFSNCEELECVELGKSVEEIGAESFLYCPKLEQVKVNNQLKKIGESAFDTCQNLKFLVLPDSVESIGMGAFLQSGIKEFKFPNKIKEISTGTFFSSDLERVILPDNVEVIGGAFAKTGITEVFIPDSVISIGDGAFNECPRELILLYNNNTLVPKYAQEHNILCFKRSEYNPVLTVELVNGKPLNDDKNQGISQEDYNLVKRCVMDEMELYAKSNSVFESFGFYISKEYITFWQKPTEDDVKDQLTKTAALLYQWGITGFDPANINPSEIDKMAAFAVRSRSDEEIEVEDKKGKSGVFFEDTQVLILSYWGFFDVKPDLSKITGYSEQQHGIWYYPMPLQKVKTEVLAFSGNLNDGNYTLKIKFTDDLGATCEKTFSFALAPYDVGHYRVILKGIQ